MRHHGPSAEVYFAAQDDGEHIAYRYQTNVYLG